MTTFGYEAEFSSGAGRLINLLTERGFARQEGERLHSYHCECSYCADLYGIPFRAQRDSSCEGEIISGIFNDGNWEHATDCMQAFQEAALDVDAVIDMNCGMHVHIGADDPVSELAPSDVLAMAWLGLEPILWEHIAGAAWARRRSSFNSLLSTAILDHMHNDRLWERHGRYPCAERDLDAEPSALRNDYIASFKLRLGGMAWDRHCDLARANHGGVYEMRIFNATRVAWRIELACRLSVALADPEVAAHFADLTRTWLFESGASIGARLGQVRNGFRRVGRAYASDDERPLLQNLPITLQDFMATCSDFDERLGELLMKQTGYAVVRKSISGVRGPISNEIDLSRWNHGEVLAALASADRGGSDA